MTLVEITTAMQIYASQRNQAGLPTMQGWYANANAWNYLRKSIPVGSPPYMHMYPGVVNGALVMFVIPAYLDSSSNTNIAEDVEACPCYWNDPAKSPKDEETEQKALPPGTALKMVGDWITHNQNWLAQNITATYSIFQGFAVPHEDTSFGNQHRGYFALKSQSGAPGGFVPDVVVQDEQSGAIQYFDTGQPVPPFPPATGGFGDFYLLQMIGG